MDPTRCPLCGQANRCAMEVHKATGLAQSPCWCVDVHFSRDLLEQLPLSVRNAACICARCADTRASPVVRP